MCIKMCDKKMQNSSLVYLAFGQIDKRMPCVLTFGQKRMSCERLIGDQIEVFKILNGYENIDRNPFSRLRKREGLEDMKLH